MLSPLRRQIRRFAREESGLIMTEFLILIPLLLWAFMALVVYWDAFRTINSAQKASYAVSDLVSRQSELSQSFINGMDKVVVGILGAPNVVSMRITSLQWDGKNNRYNIIFSRSPHNMVPGLTATEVMAFHDRIPTMAHGDTTVLVETWTNYTPPFGHAANLIPIGVDKQIFESFILTRPRFFRRICLRETPKTCPPDA